MSFRRLILPAALVALASACSASNENKFSDTPLGGGGAGTGGGATSTGSETGLFDGGFGGGSGGSSPGCAAETQFVYTLTAANELYKFDPPSLAFTLVGVLDCPSIDSPYSMAVDRSGQAWSVFTDGSLYRIDTQTAHCTPTSFVPGQHGFTTFGMGFSTDGADGAGETLYVSQADFLGGGTTMGLGKIDLASLTLSPIGMYDKVDARAELTGTGDGKLFGAFEGTPYSVDQIEKTTAKILSQAPQNAISYPPNSSNFAFAFWGGDFYLFVGPGTSTDVFHFKTADGTTTKVKSVSFEIVGAGVSTCAPTKPPS